MKCAAQAGANSSPTPEAVGAFGAVRQVNSW